MSCMVARRRVLLLEMFDCRVNCYKSCHEYNYVTYCLSHSSCSDCKMYIMPSCDCLSITGFKLIDHDISEMYVMLIVE